MISTMSMNDRDMHTVAGIGAFVLLSALLAGTWVASGGGSASEKDEAPKIEMEAIEASIAARKKPAKLPQKKIVAPPKQEEVVDKVNREADKLPDPPKEKEKPPEPPKDPKIDSKDPLKDIRRPDPDEQTGKPTEEVGAGPFDPNAKGWADETRGHPFFQGVAKDINEAWEFPKILSASNAAVGCLHITADGKIAKTKVDKSGDDQLDQSAEEALAKVERKRNANPEPPPADILKQATTRWICFKFSPQSREE